MEVGAKVNYGGSCWRVRRIKENVALITPARGYGRCEVHVNNLVAWTPKPKFHAKAKTCQCCARPIFAETGTIAHHGYTRPAPGCQTGSCFGALFPPFEVSRDRLGELIETIIRPDLARAFARRDKLSKGECALTRQERKRDERGRSIVNRYTGEYENHLVTYRPGDDQYREVLSEARNDNAGRIAALERELSDQTKRFEEWKPAGL